jgi:hypothetical protein
MQHCSWSVPSEKGGGEFLNSGNRSTFRQECRYLPSLSTRGVTDNRTYIPYQYLTSRRYGSRIIRTKFGKSSVRYIGPWSVGSVAKLLGIGADSRADSGIHFNLEPYNWLGNIKQHAPTMRVLHHCATEIREHCATEIREHHHHASRHATDSVAAFDSRIKISIEQKNNIFAA